MSSKALKIQGKEFLPLETGYLTESAIKKCKEELNETPERRAKGLQELRSLLQSKWDPSELPIKQFQQMLVMVLCQALRDPMTQINGLKIISDLDGVSYKHLKYLTPYYLFLLYNGSVNCAPARYKEFFVINESVLLKLIWRIIKPMMSEKIKSRVRFLSNPEVLFENFPRCIMPTEYGGDIPEVDIKDWLIRANKEQQKFKLQGQPNYY